VCMCMRVHVKSLEWAVHSLSLQHGEERVHVNEVVRPWVGGERLTPAKKSKARQQHDSRTPLTSHKHGPLGRTPSLSVGVSNIEARLREGLREEPPPLNPPPLLVPGVLRYVPQVEGGRDTTVIL